MVPQKRWYAVFFGGMAAFTGSAVIYSIAEEGSRLQIAMLVGSVLALLIALFGMYRAVQLQSKEEDFNPVMATWTRRFIATIVSYMATLFMATWLLDRLEGDIERALVALLPVLPVLYGIRVFTQTLSKLDELQQRIQLEAFAISIGATGAITFSLGMLEAAGFPMLSLTWVFPMLIGFWGVGVWITTRKYNAS